LELHLLDHLLESDDLGSKSIPLVLLLHLNALDEILLFQFKKILLRLESLLTIVDVVDLLFDFNNLVIEFLVHSLILCLLLLGLLKLQQFVRQLLLKSTRLLHKSLLVLHVLDQGLMQIIKLFFGLISSKI